MLPIILGLIALLSVYLVAMLALVTIKKDISIANFTWGGGVMLISWYIFFVKMCVLTFGEFALIPSCVIAIFITAWCLRMAIHLYVRYTGTDKRFAAWRKHGNLFLNILYIFGAQLVLMIAMSVTPLFILGPSEILWREPVGVFLFSIGIMVWLIGFIYESVSDYQLYNFMQKSANRGKVMRSGLWFYSRHPNYFGEIIMWWGIWLIAFALDDVAYTIRLLIQGGTYMGTSVRLIAAIPLAISLISPLTITILLRFFTGVPLLEGAMANNPEYQEYKRTTNTLVPWIPKR